MTVANEVGKRPGTGGNVAGHGASGNGAKKQADEPGVSRSDGSAERQRLRMMMLIRRFEERTFAEYTKPGQKIGGFCHLYSGQEAIAVGIAALFQKGKGGSMHFFDAEAGNMGGHGIVGGHIPLGLGFAFAQGYKKTGGVTFCLFGDGAINQGTHNESLNMASLLKAPVVWIVENNGVAMGTQVERSSAEPDLAERGCGYRMPHWNIDGNDIDVVMQEVGKAADRARRGEGPSYICANTFRFRGHSMSDPMKYRTREEMEKAKTRDPITIYEVRLREKGLITDKQIDEIEKEVEEQVKSALAQADADPHPAMEDRFDDILAEKYPYQPE